MITVSKLQVKSLDVDRLDVYWEIEDTPLDPYDYTFTVERSESPKGPFVQVSEAFSDRYHYRDIIVHLFSKWRKYWYRIKVVRKSDSVTDYSDAVTQEPRPDLIAQEIRRLELIAFREHIGRQVWVFPRRTFGQRCPDCYDPVVKKKLRGSCHTCYDTSYVRGYLDPIASLIQIDPSPRHTEVMPIAETQQQNTTARAPYFPPLRPRDIIVEAENRRWRIERATPTERLRAVLHWELVIHEVPKTDIEYKLPINIADLEGLEPSPGREFTNPHNLQATDESEWLSLMLKGHGYDV